jgi:tRNA(Arg) A34 adenosine deaminase TadA
MLLFLHNQPRLARERWTITLYTTLEPCLMCLSTALVHHIRRIVWLVDDYWAGGTRCLNHRADYLRQSPCELVHQPIPHLYARVMPLLVAFYSQKWPPARVTAMLGHHNNHEVGQNNQRYCP